MLTNTFCHLPGIGVAVERQLWAAGIDSWAAALAADRGQLPRRHRRALADHLPASVAQLARGNPVPFAGALPSHQHWRLFPAFRHTTAYLDIETTGLGDASAITTIVIYDGATIRHYVNGINLDAFPGDIMRYAVVVTYNGKCFDVPVIERFFRITMRQAHIDLRYVLKRLGYGGGLKGCERRLGIERPGLADVDGYFAVLLWDEFTRTKNSKALGTLLAYNTADAVNLETLMVLAYNRHVQQTPFGASHRQPLPAQPAIPFTADRATIDRLKRQAPGYGGEYGWR
jgi:uncharacterized protein YprB with RNaseH-like and TPR domain